MANQYKYGRDKEKQVVKTLKKSGAEQVLLSPGSRSPADLQAKWPTGKTWDVQVKSSRSGVPPVDKREKIKLIHKANKDKATPVIASVGGNEVEFHSARNDRTLTP